MWIVGTFIGHAFYHDKKWKQQKNAIERSDLVPYLLCSLLKKKVNTSFALSMLLIYLYYLLVLEGNTELQTTFARFMTQLDCGVSVRSPHWLHFHLLLYIHLFYKNMLWSHCIPAWMKRSLLRKPILLNC